MKLKWMVLAMVCGVLSGCFDAGTGTEPQVNYNYNHLDRAQVRLLSYPITNFCNALQSGPTYAQVEVFGTGGVCEGDCKYTAAQYAFSTVPNTARTVPCSEFLSTVQALFYDLDGAIVPGEQVGSMDTDCKLGVTGKLPPAFAGIRISITAKRTYFARGGPFSHQGTTDFICPAVPNNAGH